jgi:6-phosphofructokinase 1
MVTIKRVSNNPYSIDFGKAPLEEVAVSAKPMPLNYFNSEGNHVSPLFIEYMKPLAGELPEFVSLEKIFAEKLK